MLLAPGIGESRPLRCWLMGSDTMLQACGEILLGAGHELQGVISADPRLASWARARALAVLDPRDDLVQELSRQPFEHLFAITHLARVPTALLALPLRSAINFHDGPLPACAGRNVTSWAILERHARHGVTWHLMTEHLDGGAVLVERNFELAPDETSSSLNARCLASGLESFHELVAALASGTCVPTPQLGLPGRVYASADRPPAGGRLDFGRTAEELEALVRALDFGPYANPLGLARLVHGAEVLLVRRAHARSAAVAAHAPGTVLDTGAGGVRIACARGVLELTDFARLRGAPCTPTEAVRALALAPGCVLASLAAPAVQALEEFDRHVGRGERFWRARLLSLTPLAVPFPAPPAASAAEERFELELELPSRLAAHFPGQPLARLLCAAFAAFVARLGRRTAFALGYSDDALRRAGAGQPWLATRVPLALTLDLDQDLALLLTRLANELAELAAHGPFAEDLIARSPELQHLATAEEPLLPLGIDVCEGAIRPAAAARGHWDLVLRVAAAAGSLRAYFAFDARRVPRAEAGSLRDGFVEFLAGLAREPELALRAQPLVSPGELARQRGAWNATRLGHRREVCVHTLFEEQVLRTPQATALVTGDEHLSYAELDARAERLAGALAHHGVRPGSLVGLCLERSSELVVAVLATLKAGGAYLPLDPGHPRARLAFLLEDSEVACILTRAGSARSLPPGVTSLDLDALAAAPASGAPRTPVQPGDLAYVLYTSGSTGRPKGVQVEHRNVASFFAAMDERVPHDPPGVWLALTELAFDISVLELLWPLCRGFQVVLHVADEHVRPAAGATLARAPRPLAFSLFFFASEEERRGEGYRLLLEAARFADAHGFSAVWTPERHFHAFGGLFPSPAVASAALAMVTERLELRAGSVVLPLHHPIRVAEDWALVDNLSHGRVALSFASGWHPEDFVLAPENHAEARAVMLRDLEVVRALWRGESRPFPGPDGRPVEVRTLPRPVRAELPVWLTAAGNLATFEEAGRIGANVLTHLLGQSVAELAPKIVAYRAARAAAGLDPDTGQVALMLHTAVVAGESELQARVRAPLERYLASSLDLLKQHAWSFPTFPLAPGQRPRARATGAPDELAALGADERAALLAHARTRYEQTSGLLGTPEHCLAQAEQLSAIGVDELACLIDFGLGTDEVLAGLPRLDEVRRRAAAHMQAAPAHGLAAEIAAHGVTHLQCTPSLLGILCADPGARAALTQVAHLFVGGEALPPELVRSLDSAGGGTLTNFYGPTETTVWSTAETLTRGANGGAGANSIPIGRPLANTRLHVLDPHLQPLPIGVAGELFIAGDGVARGYLRRPALDEQRFLPEPGHGDASGGAERMYRTGDLVRYRADGKLEFLGRLDHQLKLRGQRVEPGEIEAALLAEAPPEESLDEALVVAREDVPGDQRLVAYLVPRGPAPDPLALRARLAARLPAHMVPSAFVFLGALPRHPNGKRDRAALPPPARPARSPASAPADELERRLAALWCETLALSEVGVDDNFFDLGGHSLLIVRLHRRLQELAPRPVSLTDLFRFPTIRSLARHLAGPSAGADAPLSAATLRGRRRRSAPGRTHSESPRP